MTQHSLPATKVFHCIGTLLNVIWTSWVILTMQPQWYTKWLLGPCFQYGFAWFSHFTIEKNRPAAWSQPVFSWIADYWMVFHVLTGQVPWDGPYPFWENSENKKSAPKEDWLIEKQLLSNYPFPLSLFIKFYTAHFRNQIWNQKWVRRNYLTTIDLINQKYKIIFLGDQNVGKTSVINRYIFGEYDEKHHVPPPTILTKSPQLASILSPRQWISTEKASNWPSGTQPAKKGSER